MAALPALLAPHEVSQTTAQSFRRYINELAGEKDLAIIDSEVDPESLELAAITRRAYETEDKAPLFNNVKGKTPEGLFHVLGAPFGASRIPGKRFIRIAKHLGLPFNADGHAIIQKLRNAKKLITIPPNQVTTGTVKENMLIGDDIDLTALPIPKLHEGDGCKFIQTFGMFVVKSPDSSWTN